MTIRKKVFITICCNDRRCLFGEIINGEMILNAHGNIAYNEWLKTTEIRSNVELDVFVIMPNHIHGIIIIKNDDYRSRGVCNTPFLKMNERDILQRSDSTPHTSDSNNISYAPDSIKRIGNTSESIKDVGDVPESIKDVDDVPESIKEIGNAPELIKGVCNTPLRSPSNNIGAIVRGYKSAVTKQINIFGSDDYNLSSTVWQRSY